MSFTNYIIVITSNYDCLSSTEKLQGQIRDDWIYI